MESRRYGEALHYVGAQRYGETQHFGGTQRYPRNKYVAVALSNLSSICPTSCATGSHTVSEYKAVRSL